MNAEDVLRYGNHTVINALEGLDESDLYTPDVCGVWSVKEIIAHLASFELMLLDVLNTFLGDEPTPTLDRFLSGHMAFNDNEVGRRRDNSFSDVWNEYGEAHKQALSLIARIPVVDRRVNGSLPWYGEEYDLEDFIAYSFYGHKREHCAQINVFKDLLARPSVET